MNLGYWGSCVRKLSWLNLSSFLAMLLEYRRRPRRTSFRTVGVPVEIQTGHLLHRSFGRLARWQYIITFVN
jgi:hypothetical protein